MSSVLVRQRYCTLPPSKTIYLLLISVLTMNVSHTAQGHDLDYVGPHSLLFFFGPLTYHIFSINGTDFVIIYAGITELGETAFKFASQPSVSVASSAQNVTSTFTNGTLTLNYELQGSQYVNINGNGTNINVVLLDKNTATTWHAPVIPGTGAFGQFFSVGSNET